METPAGRPREAEGRESVRVAEALSAIEGSRLSAGEFQDLAESVLRSAGYEVAREVRVDLGDGRKSRIDLVLDGWFALELDRRTPRKRSLLKVRRFGAGMVYCRHPA